MLKNLFELFSATGPFGLGPRFRTRKDLVNIATTKKAIDVASPRTQIFFSHVRFSAFYYLPMNSK